MNTSRIRDLAKQQGKSVTYICKLINRPKYYLNDVDKKPDRMISDEDLKTLAINLGTTAEYLKRTHLLKQILLWLSLLMTKKDLLRKSALMKIL